MADIKMDVGSYTGHEGVDSPRVFFVHGEKITVLKVQRMWTEEGDPGKKQKRFFTLHGSDGFVHTVYLDLAEDRWYYRGFERAAGGRS